MIRTFLRFAALAGCGWLLDFALLLLLVRYAGVAPFLANVVSSLVAASAVFLTARLAVFARAEGGLPVRFGLFLAYTLTVILVASAAVEVLAAHASQASVALGLAPLGVAQAAAVAKVIVTPPQLLLNFVVSRLLAEYGRVRATA